MKSMIKRGINLMIITGKKIKPIKQNEFVREGRNFLLQTFFYRDAVIYVTTINKRRLLGGYLTRHSAEQGHRKWYKWIRKD